MTTLQTRRGEYLLLQSALPGRKVEEIGVMLWVPDSGELLFRLRRDWLEIAEPEEAEVLFALSDDLERKRDELGGEGLLQFLEDTASNALRIGERQTVLVDRPNATLKRLYERHVPAHVLPFDTHLPRYAFRPAAGGFGAAREANPDDVEWVEAPEDLRITDKMFVVTVTGRSMEPLIASGSDCVFREGVAGSRNGRMVLVVDQSAALNGGRYTVKRYRSEKTVTEDGYRHERIWLEPLNPEYDPIELTEDESVRVVAEYVRTL